MATNSASAGYLAPSDVGPLYDAALDDVFHDVIAGLTGIANELIRPRWQVEPPNLPSFTTNWVAFGVTVDATQWNAYQVHDPTINPPNGANVVEGTETLHINCSFYGPDYEAYERRFRTGMQVEQNRDALTELKIKFIGFEDPVHLPVLLREKWTNRMDTKMICNRWCRRVYPILSLSTADGYLDNEHYLTLINVTP